MTATLAEMIFDDALAAAQTLEQAAIPYFLALLAPACEPIDSRLVSSLAQALDVDELRPDVAQLWCEAHDAGNPLRASILTVWLKNEAGTPKAAWDAVELAENVAEFASSCSGSINPARTAEHQGEEFHER